MSKTFKNASALTYGIELEFESEDRAYDCDTIRSLGRDLFLYSTRDGSLRTGAEIHTHAMTFDAMQKMSWKPFQEIRKNGAKSYNTDTAGLHVHLSRDAFSLFHWFRFVEFFYTNMNLTDTIMKRKNYDNLNNYAYFSKNELKSLKKAVLGFKNNKSFSNREHIKRLRLSTEKSRAFNYNHEKTFELRFFGGSLSEAGFKSKIDYIQAVYELTRFRTPRPEEFKSYIENSNHLPYIKKAIKRNDFKKAFENPTYVNPEILMSSYL